MKIFIYFCVLSPFLCNFEIAHSATCMSNSKISGFTTVKSPESGRAYFYKEPQLCIKGKPCRSIRKAYLIPDNFVQTSKVNGQFVCATFQNFNGKGGKETTGWLLLKDLNPIRKRLKLSDLVGDWWQIPCDSNDDCGIFISADKSNKLEIDIFCHLHEHPSEIFNVKSIKKLPGKLLLSGTDGGGRTTDLELIYDDKSLEPGTIRIKGSEVFQGEYNK